MEGACRNYGWSGLSHISSRPAQRLWTCDLERYASLWYQAFPRGMPSDKQMTCSIVCRLPCIVSYRFPETMNSDAYLSGRSWEPLVVLSQSSDVRSSHGREQTLHQIHCRQR